MTLHDEPKGVLMDVASYGEPRRAALLLRLVAQGEADARAGRIVPQAKIFADLRRQLTRR